MSVGFPRPWRWRQVPQMTSWRPSWPRGLQESWTSYFSGEFQLPLCSDTVSTLRPPVLCSPQASATSTVRNTVLRAVEGRKPGPQSLNLPWFSTMRGKEKSTLA